MSKNLQLSDNVNYISPEMFQEILAYTKKNLGSRKLHYTDIQMIFKIAYYSGLRVNEVLKLRRKDFNFNLLEINLGQTKTEQRGIASIPSVFKEELKSYLFEFKILTDNELLFPITRQTAYEWIMQIGRDLKINAWTTPQTESKEKTKTHIFRKSIGKDMLYKGASLNIIQRKLRHNNINTTSEYLKLKLNDVKNWENENL